MRTKHREPRVRRVQAMETRMLLSAERDGAAPSLHAGRYCMVPPMGT